MSKQLLVADLFCGAGGSSTGARRALRARGIGMKLVAVNHWDVAIETHQRNHPEARHLLSNVYCLAPREAVPEGRLDLLMASPTCTFHSRARGGKPVSRDQKYGRMTPTQVVRWVTDLRVRCLIVENVPEFVRWGPVHREVVPEACSESGCRPERPCKRRAGTYFRSWIRRLEGAGFRLEWRVLNAADYGDATTRQRFFLIARSDRKKLRWPVPSHSKDGNEDLFGGGTRRWRPAREIIDWSLQGKSIFRRKRPLSPRTLDRIMAGAVKFNWPDPFLVILRRHMAGRSLDDPLPTITAGGTHIALAQPIILPQNGSNKARSTEDPAPVITTTSRGIAVVEPFVLSRHSGGAPRSVSEPTPTQVAKHSHVLISPHCEPAEDRLGFVCPVTHVDKSNRARSLDQPIPTVTGANRGELAFIAASFGERAGQAPRVHSVEKPAPTVCATGRINLVEARGFDILFRMLQPHELAAAMGFSDENDPYEFCGNKTEKVRQIGNAVPVNTASALVGALMGTR